MNALEHLLECYDHWRRSTETEAAALQAADWPTATRCQETKAALQRAIVEAIQAAEPSAARDHSTAAAMQRELHATLNSLIDLETANLEVLAAQRERCERRQRELQLASRTLGRVHRAYGAGLQPSWQSYS